MIAQVKLTILKNSSEYQKCHKFFKQLVKSLSCVK